MKARKTVKESPVDLRAAQKSDFYIFAGVIFASTFIYFLIIADNVLFFQKEQFLFLFSGEYLKGFVSRPGGLLEYAGKFIMQFYSVPVLGSFLIAIALTLPAILVYKILKNTIPGSALLLPMSVFPSILLLLMQNQYYHMMEYNLGFICIPAYFLLTTKYRKPYLPVVLFPLLYYIAGAFALIILAAFIVYYLISDKGPRKLLNPALLLITAFSAFLLFKEALFLVPVKSLLTYPLPLLNEPFHRIFFVTLSLYLILFPLVNITGSLRKKRAKVIRYTGITAAGAMVFLAAFLIAGTHNRSISTVMDIQKSAYESNWDEVIRLNEKYPPDNLISQFFYNTALSEKGLLCEKLFTVNQDFGTKGLILPWGGQYIERGAYFFYTTGLINEAHRWAYEEMVIYGPRPHNILMLIKTSLLSGNFSMAEKYTGILKKTAFYRDEALKYEKMLYDRESIATDPELEPIAGILPQKDFFIYIESPEDNLPMLFDANPQNKRAFEYMMSWLLLEKDVETVLSNLHLMKGLGYTKLPRYVEEAVMIYYNSQRTFPDMGGLTISPATLARFEQYFNTYMKARNNPAMLQQTMKERFGDTFWYYFHFRK